MLQRPGGANAEVLVKWAAHGARRSRNHAPKMLQAQCAALPDQTTHYEICQLAHTCQGCALRSLHTLALGMVTTARLDNS